jgi:hypothetical protein
LGISSIDQLLKANGGEIEISSELGKGFSLRLSIPLKEKIVSRRYVLIDNDKLIRINWEMEASRKNVSIRTFSSVEEFLRCSTEITTDTMIYIDSDLGGGLKGEEVSEEVFHKGYQNIYLATGFLASDLDLKSYPWIKGVHSKKVPF